MFFGKSVSGVNLPELDSPEQEQNPDPVNVVSDEVNLPLHVDVPKKQDEEASEKIFQAELGKDIVTA